MSEDFEVVDIARIGEWQRPYEPDRSPHHTVLARDAQVLGIARPELVYLLPDADSTNVVDAAVLFVTPNTSWPVIMRGMRNKQADTALVINRRRSRRSGDLAGVITSREIANNAGESAELLE